MLLAVSFSMLDRLGIRLSDLEEIGLASVSSNLGRLPSGFLKVVSLLESTSPPQDLNAELLTAESMAKRMQCTRANVYEREKKGMLFSVLPPGRENGRRYPAFQISPKLDSVMLARLIERFRLLNAPMALLWDFLRSVQPSLGGLTGVELMLGVSPKRSGIDLAVIGELKKLEAAKLHEYVIDHALEGLSHALS